MAPRSGPRLPLGRRLAGLGRSDASLLAGGRTGSDAAAATLLDRHGDELWTLLRHLTTSPAAATSAMATTWRAAWTGAPDRPAGPVAPWLLGLAWPAARAALDEDRDTLRWDTDEPAIEDLPAGAGAEPLVAALHALDDLERAAVVLEARHGATPAADATILGLPDADALHAVRARAHAALAGLPRARDADERHAREAVVAGRPAGAPADPAAPVPAGAPADPPGAAPIAAPADPTAPVPAAAPADPAAPVPSGAAAGPADAAAPAIAAAPADPAAADPAGSGADPAPPSAVAHPAAVELAAVLPGQREALKRALPLVLPAAARAAAVGAYVEVKDEIAPPARGARGADEPWWAPRPGHDPGFGPPDPTDTRVRAGAALLVALAFAGVGYAATDGLRGAGDDRDAVVTATPVGPLPPGVDRTP